MGKEQVLAHLQAAGDRYCSGGEMSKALGVSRTAVWKAVEGLRGEGYLISSRQGLGYRLEDGPDRPRAGALAGMLKGCALGGELVFLDEVDSTSSEVKRRRLSGAGDGLVVIADRQTRGRGRRGRDFSSPGGLGLYLSVLLHPAGPLSGVAQLTAWAAVAVREGIGACCGISPGIKWPNDLVSGGKKLCGILTELELEAETGDLAGVILGVGINVGQTEDDFGPALSPIATSLFLETGRMFSRAALAGHVLRALDGMYAAFPDKRERYLAEYRAACVTVGRDVSILRGETKSPGFAESVTDDFSLTIRNPDGNREIVTAGEVSVRGILGYL